MSEEARNTDRRSAAWGATNFRNNGISFVSAGTLKREEDAWNTVSEDDSPQKQSEAEPESTHIPPHKVPSSLHQPTVEDETTTEPPIVSGSVASAPLQERETASGSQPTSLSLTEAQTLVSEAPVTDSVDTPSKQDEVFSDSDEEIVFVGRQNVQPSRRPTPAPSKLPTTETLPMLDKTRVDEIPASDTLPSHFSMATTIGLDSPANHFTPSRKSKQKNLRRFDDEDALMQDYIDNMALSDDNDEAEEDPTPMRKPFKKTEHIRMFGGDGLENAKVQMRPRIGTRAKAEPVQAIDWDSDDLADFDDLSTTDEEIEEIGQVIRHRERETGVQYLVVAEGLDASDAKWMLHSRLTSESAIAEIKIFHEIRMMDITEDDLDENEAEDSESDEIQDLIDDIESEDDENARIMNYASRMTDEQIARVLAKQEELGLGSDELMLFDGEAANGASDAMDSDTFGLGTDYVPFSLKKHTSNRGRSKRNKKQRDSFPSAEAFADALDQDPYGAFDIMDFDRPSLRPKKKGRKSDYPWDLEGLDEELRDGLIDTWTKDREKKAARKREKEEARLQFALENEEGGDPAVIKARVRSFLVQETEVLKLSPMDSATRAAVHRLAKALKLNSRSEGKEGLGVGRYPVLTKTPKTPFFTIDTIWEVDALLNTRKFFPRSSHRTPRTPRSTGALRTRRGGGGLMSGATYRDGDEVAASAPEIGSENRGRAMLEKMGWSPGVGIGAVGNKGSLDPIKHIVKTSKAGLG